MNIFFQTCVETVTYTPFAMCSFYFGMSLLEMKPVNEAAAEVEAKFWPTYKVNSNSVYIVLKHILFRNIIIINFCNMFISGWSICLASCSFGKFLSHTPKKQGSIY